MAFNWRKWNRFIHRDFGYFFFGMTIIYALSGIAINHIKDWNPSYSIENSYYDISNPQQFDHADQEKIIELLALVNEEDHYKKHYYLLILLKYTNYDFIQYNNLGLILNSIFRSKFFYSAVN